MDALTIDKRFTLGANRWRVIGRLADGSVRAVCIGYYMPASSALGMPARWVRTGNGALATFTAAELAAAKLGGF